MTTIRAIETRYKGYRFRSRLEARWAVFLDALGAKWQYEKEGYDLGKEGCYLPDFWIPFTPEWTALSCWPSPGRFFEVKPIRPSVDECRKAAALTALTKHHCYFLIGPPGDGETGFACLNGEFGPNAVERLWRRNDGSDKAWEIACGLASTFHQVIDVSLDDIWSAIYAARSARFEHG